jgi:hypothetical protein
MGRVEFGAERVSCSCRECRRNCMFMPGFLIPSDLDRMIPPGADPLQWAEINLLASPGTIVSKDGEIFRIPTLVPATKPDGSCIHYQRRGCAIWENSPFGCAFFGCGAQDEDRLSHLGVNKIYLAQADPESLYNRIWHHLWDLNKRQEPVEAIRERMNRGNRS